MRTSATSVYVLLLGNEGRGGGRTVRESAPLREILHVLIQKKGGGEDTKRKRASKNKRNNPDDRRLQRAAATL